MEKGKRDVRRKDRRMSEWQGIESAPRPCGEVLVWSSVYNAPVIAKGGNDGKFWEGDWEFEVRATHWMPLPDPPDAQGIAKAGEMGV